MRLGPSHWFALLFVAAFFGAGLVPEDSPLYWLLGMVLVVGVVAICFGLLHPSRRR